MKLYEGTGTLEILEWAKRYNRWIADQFTPILRGKVIEIGAGTGNISVHMAPSIQILYATDIDRQLLRKMKTRFSSRSDIRVQYFDISRRIPQNFYQAFDSVVSVNVLEHIKNDTAAIRNMYALLKKGGSIGILVPAKKWAHTKLDTKLGHFRRYEKEELYLKLHKAGFHIRKLYFFNSVGLITWIIRNIMDKEADGLKSYQIWLFEHLVPILSFVERYIPVPIGISLIAIAQK